jgi:hypothetical protein
MLAGGGTQAGQSSLDSPTSQPRSDVMSSVLDQFGESLVRASRTFYEQHANNAPAETASTTTGQRRSFLGVRLHRRGQRIALGALLVGILAAAGTSVFGPTGNPAEITQIDCGEGRTVANVTGEPVRDCTTLWQSIYHHPAPPLVAWVYETGGTVVVTPVDHPPSGHGWRRLPSGWKANAAVLGLHLQLEDITTGLEAHRCWSASQASTLVTSILRADGLGSWQVRVKTERANSAHPTCLTVAADTSGAARWVLLVERPEQEPPGWSRPFPSGPIEHARLTSAEARVNSSLASEGRCASVTQAARLWRSTARAAGIPDARYVLFTQTNSHNTTRCARVLVNTPGGGGPANVYAADLP